jgi:hypothetical protein
LERSAKIRDASRDPVGEGVRVAFELLLPVDRSTSSTRIEAAEREAEVASCVLMECRSHKRVLLARRASG